MHGKQAARRPRLERIAVVLVVTTGAIVTSTACRRMGWQQT